MVSEYEGANNTTYSTRSYNGSRAESTLPLANDVVVLVCKGVWDVGKGGANNEESTKISDATRFGKSKQADSNDFDEAIEKKEWRTQVPPVR